MRKNSGERNSQINDKKFLSMEKGAVKIYENIFNEKFTSVRPSWLMNHQTGFLIELDGFCDTLKLAFEFDGIQHHEYPNPFHQTYRQIESQRKRDEMKNYNDKIYDVTLIRVEYDVQNLEECIKHNLKKNNFI